jgi:hypothetical protein
MDDRVLADRFTREPEEILEEYDVEEEDEAVLKSGNDIEMKARFGSEDEWQVSIVVVVT